ncbi:MAG: mannose-1-phosphate guanylyltransferase/mannose-6-phosphate isomerase [Calditerrivibrio nitroreducens]|uniref:mannose-1-phosphate guanylyltransferase n=1 Tax=Calditerrivibrio nitroreducens TaxID=477976 RepID=A0A2J6WM75_9BACT|nr:MAG: mannose-1-phosphate guanylyltransferase/mannose-6-phosphate isomerase [Calditerrivibrio nitroreducens]
MKNLILSGGSGTRLWPLSRRLLPKQYLKLFDGKSLFQLTVERNLKFCSSFIIISNEDQYFLAIDQMEENSLLNSQNLSFILEPFGRNTAGAIAFGAFDSDENEILFVTPSDHLIKNESKYIEAINKGRDLAKEGYLVTFGITPDSPNTGYGYIQAKPEINVELGILNVELFHEKPDLDTAIKYLEKNSTFNTQHSTLFLWNSGMFMFKAGVYLEELKTHAPEVYESSKKAFENSKKINGNQKRIVDIFMEKIPDISVDYAVMEKSKNIKVVLSEFEWNDVGSFDSLIKEVKTDREKIVEIDGEENFLYSDNDKKVISTIGLRDFIVIDTNDALLIAKKGQTQKVKDIVNQLKTTNNSLLTTHSKVHRPWGTYEVLIDEKNYKIKRIVVKPGKRLSLQKHFHRNEHWIVVSGTAEVQVGDKVYLVRPNESTYIKMGDLHRLGNPGKIPVVLIEAQVGEYTGEDDIVRIDDDFYRGN